MQRTGPVVQVRPKNYQFSFLMLLSPFNVLESIRFDYYDYYYNEIVGQDVGLSDRELDQVEGVQEFLFQECSKF